MAKDESMGRGPRKSIDWEGMVERACPASRFTAQTANGTAKTFGTGWNKDFSFSMPELPPDPTRPAGRSNRTGE